MYSASKENDSKHTFSAFPSIKENCTPTMIQKISKNLKKIAKEKSPIIFSIGFITIFMVVLTSPSPYKSLTRSEEEHHSFIRGDIREGHHGAVMHTYVGREDEKKFDSESEMNDFLSFWQSKWEEVGWKAVILTESDAQSHSLYETSQNEVGIHRWLAMSAVGGVWFADYRTFPLSLDPQEDAFKPPNNGAFTVHDPRFNKGYKPTLVSALPTEWEKVVDIVSPYAHRDVIPSAYTEVFLGFNTERQGRIGVIGQMNDGVVSGVKGDKLSGRTQLKCDYYSRATAVHLAKTDMEVALSLELLQRNEGNAARSDSFYIRRFLNMLHSQCPLRQGK